MAKEPLVNNFEVPSWAGKPPSGLHLDVLKEGKMIQKLMIDEKKCYFFGRNKQLCDFCIDHASCSRVHAALVWHKHLSRPFIMDLGSTHGTFIGHIRLESQKPQQVPIDSEIHFGASTRIYTIRERPQPVSNLGGSEEMEKRNDDIEGGLLGLPESETELDNLTEFNTAHNRRIASLVDIPDHSVPNPMKRKRKSTHVIFRDEDEIINPEDIDPTVGKFRNLVQTSIIPSKRTKVEASTGSSNMGVEPSKRSTNFPFNTPSLYGDLPPHTEGLAGGPGSYSIAAKLGLPIPNLAPNLEEEETVIPVVKPNPVVLSTEESTKEPKKKKYAKEAWPGKKPLPTLLV